MISWSFKAARIFSSIPDLYPLLNENGIAESFKITRNVKSRQKPGQAVLQSTLREDRSRPTAKGASFLVLDSRRGSGASPPLPAPITAAAAAWSKPLSVIPIWQLAWVWIHLSKKETLPTLDELNNCDTHWARFSNAPQQIYSAVAVNWSPSSFLTP